MIIDIHAHTSTHRMRGLHTDSATILDLERIASRRRIDKIVLMATYFPFKGSGLHNNELLSRVAGKELFSVFGSLDVTGDFSAGLDELTKLAEEKKIVGIKLYPGYQFFSPSDQNIFPIYELAQKFDLPVAIHTGELHHCCPREKRDQGLGRCGMIACPLDDDATKKLAHPESIHGAAVNFPKVNFILCHLSDPYFTSLRSLMLECPNVYSDISGQFLSGTDEASQEEKQKVIIEILKILDLPNGINRLMFGTDFPIQSYFDSIQLVESLGLNEYNSEKIYSGNALKIIFHQ